MSIKEFNDFITHISNTFVRYPDYEHLVSVSNEELLLRVIGYLFQAYLDQYTNCPLSNEFDLDSETDMDSFYYDFKTHFEGTCELELVEAFITICIFYHNNGIVPRCPESETETDVLNYCNNEAEDADEFDITELVLQTLTLIPNLETFSFEEDKPNKFHFLQPILYNIYLILYLLNANIQQLVTYKAKIEEIYE